MSYKMISLLLIVSYVLQGTGLDTIGSQSNKLNDKFSGKSLSFSWSSCSQPKDSIQVQSLSLLPDPIDIPGKIYLATNFTINSTESSPLQLSINVKKKVVYFWVTIPCEHGLGSCSYPDVCQLTGKHRCPDAFKKYGIPCKCPLPRGIYYLPSSVVADIDKSILPSWLESGQYKARAQLYDNNSNEVLCIDLSLTAEAGFKSSIFDFNNNFI